VGRLQRVALGILGSYRGIGGIKFLVSLIGGSKGWKQFVNQNQDIGKDWGKYWTQDMMVVKGDVIDVFKKLQISFADEDPSILFNCCLGLAHLS